MLRCLHEIGPITCILTRTDWCTLWMWHAAGTFHLKTSAAVCWLESTPSPLCTSGFVRKSANVRLISCLCWTFKLRQATRMWLQICPIMSKLMIMPDAELNNWFRQIQSLHKATLSLKLRIIILSKLVAHNAALYAPTARQMPSTHVLARKLGQPLFTAKQWRVWTQDLIQEGTVSKATSSRLTVETLKGFVRTL